MILGFKTQLNGKPTHFVEKILIGLTRFEVLSSYVKDDLKHLIQSHATEAQKAGYLSPAVLCRVNPKIHTIREDISDRWKNVSLIHFSVGVRTKNYLRFAPVIEVYNIQSIWIDAEKKGVIIDGHVLPDWKIETLAKNDGFDTLDDFWSFFKGEPKRRKLIHWTPTLY